MLFEPLISDPFAIGVLLTCIVFISLRLDARFSAFRALGAAVVGILLAMVLSNLGVIPGQSPAYEFIRDVPLDLALALILTALFSALPTTPS